MRYQNNFFGSQNMFIYIVFIIAFFMGIPQTVSAQTETIPSLTIEATSELMIDNDGSESASIGDTLRYHVTVTNESDVTATRVRFLGRIDDYLTLVEDSVVLSQGTVWPGTLAQAEFGELAGGESVTIEFDAIIEAGARSDQVLTSIQISFAEDVEAPDETGGLTQNQNLVVTQIDAPTALAIADEPSIQRMIFLPIIWEKALTK